MIFNKEHLIGRAEPRRLSLCARFALFAALLPLVHFLPLAAAQVDNEPAPSVEELVSDALDSERRDWQRREALRQLNALHDEVRARALREIVERGDILIAQSAAILLVHEDDPAIAAFLAEAIADWSAEYQLYVIQSLRPEKRGRPLEEAWRVLPRIALRSVIRRIEAGEPINGYDGFLAGDAALMLAKEFTPEDARLIRRALALFPHAHLWLARTMLGELSNDELAVAASIYSEANANPVGRFATAVAASHAREDAREYIREVVEGVIERFGDRDGEEIIRSAWGGLPAPGTQEREDYESYNLGASLIAQMLEYAHEPLARELLSRCLQVQDKGLRNTARGVADRRFPDLLARRNDE